MVYSSWGRGLKKANFPSFPYTLYLRTTVLTIKECSSLIKSGDFPEPNTFCLPYWEREKVRLFRSMIVRVEFGF